jgi:hypothetical protein
MNILDSEVSAGLGWITRGLDWINPWVNFDLL